jgi:hypothetical protein
MIILTWFTFLERCGVVRGTVSCDSEILAILSMRVLAFIARCGSVFPLLMPLSFVWGGDNMLGCFQCTYACAACLSAGMHDDLDLLAKLRLMINTHG